MRREAKGGFLGPGMGGKKLMAKWIPHWEKKKSGVNNMHSFEVGGGVRVEWAQTRGPLLVGK